MQNSFDPAIMPPHGSSETEKELYAETKEAFLEDLECLYIHGNQGGRLMFADKWPKIAEMIFDPALVGFDHNGVQNDAEREKRAELEDKAAEKRDEILAYFEGMEKGLVMHGSLQLSVLEKIMQKLDRTLAELVFSERFVDKYFPNSQVPKAPPSAETTSDNAQNAPESQQSASSQSAPSDAGTNQNAQGDAPQVQPPQSQLQAETQSSATSLASPVQSPSSQNKPVHKESIVVPDSDVNSIGHVDHTYNASMPDYDAKKNGDSDEDAEDGASWLDMPEDEFGDVQPISLDAPSSQPSEETSPAPDENKPRAMGLSGHQGTQDAQTPEPLTQAEDQNQSAQTPPVAPPHPEQEPQSSGLRKPSLPGEEQQGSSRPPLPPQEHHDNMPSPPTSSMDNAPPQVPSSAPQSSHGMGLQAHQQKQGASAPQSPENSAQTPVPPSSPDAALPSSAPPLPGAQPDNDDPNASENKEEENKPRKPSLDDIDSHLGSSSGQRPSGPPPLPGKDDEDSLF
ncbi:MAG: hypothetical protein ACLFR0_01455 [Alphaproteobacteria bacterium]